MGKEDQVRRTGSLGLAIPGSSVPCGTRAGSLYVVQLALAVCSRAIHLLNNGTVVGPFD